MHKSGLNASSKIWSTLEHAKRRALHALANYHFVRQPSLPTPFGVAIMTLTFLPHANNSYQPIQGFRYYCPNDSCGHKFTFEALTLAGWKGLTHESVDDIAKPCLRCGAHPPGESSINPSPLSVDCTELLLYCK